MKYSEIENLAKLFDAVMALRGAEISVKLDGTNVGFGMVDGHVVARGRNNWYMHPTESASLTNDGFSFVRLFLTPYLQSGGQEALEIMYKHLGNFCVFGEWFGNGIQRRINYGEKQFMAFDIWVQKHNEVDTYDWLDPITARNIITNANIPYVPVIFCGEITSIEEFKKLMDENLVLDCSHFDSKWSGVNEGVVIKPIHRDQMKDDYGHRFIAKFKSEQFKERMTAKAPHSEKVKDESEVQRLVEIESIANIYFGPNRFEPQLAKLIAEGINVMDNKNIPIIIRRISDDASKDLQADCVAGIINYDFKEIMKFCGKMVTTQLREHQNRVMNEKA